VCFHILRKVGVVGRSNRLRSIYLRSLSKLDPPGPYLGVALRGIEIERSNGVLTGRTKPNIFGLVSWDEHMA
jgi:hypothetical protein